MPAFNGTGPAGQGPMTGHGLGPCGGGQTYGRGLKRGFGRGSGFGRFFGFGYQQPTKSQDTSDTKAYIADLEDELKSAQDHLQDLQKNK